MKPERFRELATQHVLHGLAGEELAEFEAELGRRGEEGRRELERLKETIAAVALGAAPVEPSAQLRERLLAQVRSEVETSPDTPRALSFPIRRRVGPWVAVAGIAASIALALGIWNARLQDELQHARQALSLVQEQLAEADSLRVALGSLSDDLMTITSPEAAAITLTGTEAEPGARARAFVDPITGRALLYVYELPILPPDSVYQLWAIRGQTPVDAGTFTVGSSGRARLQLEASDAVLSADALAVTIEPAPGLPAPSGPIVMSGAL